MSKESSVAEFDVLQKSLTRAKQAGQGEDAGGPGPGKQKEVNAPGAQLQFHQSAHR
jgi:hypothetical protein